ncbi:hypothetical protein THOM_0642, partial [Trachipleistophora hominis]
VMIQCYLSKTQTITDSEKRSTHSTSDQGCDQQHNESSSRRNSPVNDANQQVYNNIAQHLVPLSHIPGDQFLNIINSYKKVFYSEDEYIKKMMSFLKSKYPITDIQACIDVISTIYNYFNGNMNRIVIVLAHSIFTTSGFTRLINLDTIHDPYGCKGILQFYGMSNYELASDNFDFVSQPDKMAVLGTTSTIGTLQGYSKINFGNKVDYFFESLVGLNPGEVQVLNLNKESTKTKIIERVTVLNQIKNLFRIPILFAESGLHIPTEIREILQSMPDITFNTDLRSSEPIIIL